MSAGRSQQKVYCNHPKFRNFKRLFRTAWRITVWRVGGGRASAGFGRGSDVSAWDFGIAGPRRLAIRGHFAPIPCSGPSTALRVRCRFVWFAFVAPSASRPAAVTRPQRAVRAGRVGSALFPARRALRSGRGMDDPLRVWPGWRWVLRCWPRSVACRRSGRRRSRRCQTRADWDTTDWDRHRITANRDSYRMSFNACPRLY